MKFILPFILIPLLFITQVNAQNFPTAEVNYLGASEPGTILLEVVGYGDRADLAMQEAQKKAFYILFYRGVPGSKQTKPLIENEIDSNRNHPRFFDEFFNQGRYTTFVMDAWTESKFKKKQLVARVKINLNALKRDLEENNVIRKFGL